MFHNKEIKNCFKHCLNIQRANKQKIYKDDIYTKHICTKRMKKYSMFLNGFLQDSLLSQKDSLLPKISRLSSEAGFRIPPL